METNPNLINCNLKKLTMTAKNITCGKIETGTNWRINLDVITFFLPVFFLILVFCLLTIHGFTHLVVYQKKKLGVHTNWSFDNYQCYGLCTLCSFTYTQPKNSMVRGKCLNLLLVVCFVHSSYKSSFFMKMK